MDAKIQTTQFSFKTDFHSTRSFVIIKSNTPSVLDERLEVVSIALFVFRGKNGVVIINIYVVEQGLNSRYE